MDIILWLQRWYEENCTDEWQHFYGIKIETLDNPGWLVEIDIAETNLENKPFNTIEYNLESEKDWIHCEIKNNVFKGACSLNNLIEIINIFKEWVETNNSIG